METNKNKAEKIFVCSINQADRIKIYVTLKYTKKFILSLFGLVSARIKNRRLLRSKKQSDPR